jgi:hypothetical protein
MGRFRSTFSAATPAGRYARSGRRDAANRRSSVSSRRLWEAHSSVVAESYDHAVDGTIVTVGQAIARSIAAKGLKAIVDDVGGHDDSETADRRQPDRELSEVGASKSDSPAGGASRRLQHALTVMSTRENSQRAELSIH